MSKTYSTLEGQGHKYMYWRCALPLPGVNCQVLTAMRASARTPEDQVIFLRFKEC